MPPLNTVCFIPLVAWILFYTRVAARSIAKEVAPGHLISRSCSNANVSENTTVVFGDLGQSQVVIPSTDLDLRSIYDQEDLSFAAGHSHNGSELAARDSDDEDDSDKDDSKIQVPISKPWMGLYDLPNFTRRYIQQPAFNKWRVLIPKDKKCWADPSGGPEGKSGLCVTRKPRASERKGKTKRYLSLFMSKS